MARLGDLVGTLMADVASARVRADWETVKLAEAYAAHDLLRHMPVPRFRLPEVRVDIPIVVDQIDPGGGGAGTVYGKPLPGELSTIIRQSLAQAGLHVPLAQRRKVYTAVQRKVEELFRVGPQVLLNSRRLGKEIETTALLRLQPAFKELAASSEQVALVTSSVRERTGALLLSKLLQSSSLQVRLASSEVREFVGSDAVMRVHLSITEDAMELLHEEHGGETTRRLVPE